MKGSERKVVLLTGATTGIGLALSRALLKTDYRLAFTARASSMARFQKLGIREDQRLILRPLDVTQPREADHLIRELEHKWQGVDVLINNAGICYRSVIEHLTDRDEEHQMRVNYFGPLHLIRLVLPGMRARGKGHIINLSSVGGMMAMPTMGAYSASKFALEGASEALWYELRPWGIKVTLIEPGFVHSSSFENALFTERSHAAYLDRDRDYHPYYRHMIPMIGKFMHLSPTRPEDIARKIIRVMAKKRPPLRVSATWDAVFFSMLRRLLPNRLYHWALYRGLPHIRDWAHPKREPPR